MADITVPVPDDRTAEFYQIFGLWLAGSLTLNMAFAADPSKGSTEGSKAAPDLAPWGDTEQDLADAVTLWKKYSPNARAMFGLLMDNPDKKFTGSQIAEAVGIPNGAHGVAGVLAWPGRHGAAIGRRLPSGWREDPETFETYYWIPSSRAELFKTARANVENTG